MKIRLFLSVLLFSSLFIKPVKANIVHVVVNQQLNTNINFPDTYFNTILGQNLNCEHWDFTFDGFQIIGNTGLVGLIDPTLNSTNDGLKKLNAGFLIDGTSTYSIPAIPSISKHSENNLPAGYCITNSQNAIFGFKVISGGQTYYGWMRVLRVSAEIATIVEYAYDNTPNTPIPAGQTITLVTNINVTSAGGATTISVDNGTLQMNATVLPTIASIQTVTWSVVPGTGNATINASGLLTAVSNGTVTVVATANDGSGVTGSMVITLSNQIAPVTSVSVAGQGGATTITTAGGTLQMIATILPTYASNQVVSWSVTGGTGFGTINSSTGLLTAVANGTIIVTATTTDGTNLTGSATITASNQLPVSATGILVSGAGGVNTITTNLGTLQILATFTPSYTTNQNVTWSVVNGTGSATISAGGLLSALTDGTVQVVATAQDGSGVSGSMTVTISNQIVFATSILVNSATGATIINTNGGTLLMNATVLPTNTSNQNVTWSVSNGTGSASISPTGVLTAISNGTVTVVATAQDGTGVFGTRVITLINQIAFQLVSSITISSLTNQVVKNNTLQMYKTIFPATASVQNVNWSVINGSGTATISSTGLLTGTGLGVVTVLASALDTSGVVGSKIITIVPPATVGIEELNELNIQVSPNPFTNELVIHEIGNSPVKYQLLNAIGQVILYDEVNKFKNVIKLSQLASGTYFLKLISAERTIASFRLLKSN